MNLELIQLIIQWFGGLLAFVALGFVLYGVWRGTKRQTGRTTGLGGSWLRSPWLYFASAVFFFGIAYLGWTPLPLIEAFGDEYKAYMQHTGKFLPKWR